MLRAALQEANMQREAAVQRIGELEKYEPRLRSMHFEVGKAELEIENSDALHFLAEICVKLLADAPNFQTAEVLLRQTGEQFNVSVERVCGKSIAKTLSELRERVATLEAELAGRCAVTLLRSPESVE